MNMQELNLAEMNEINGGRRGSKTVIIVRGDNNTVVGTQNGLINVGSLNLLLGFLS